MSTHRIHGVALQAIVATLLLAGCGGGGGGDATPALGGNAAALSVTTDNALALGAEALDTATRMDLARVAARLVLQVELDPGAPTGMVQVGNVPAPGFSCPGGGSVTMGWTTAHDFDITLGDKLALVASNCSSAIPEADSLSGRLDAQVAEGTWQAMVAYDRHPRFVRLAMQAPSLTIVANGRSVTSSGDMSLAATESYGSQGRFDLSGTALVDEFASASGRRSVTLGNYQQQVLIGGGSASFDAAASIESSNPRLASAAVRYALSTPSTLATNAAGEFTAGTLKASAEHSSLTVTVIGTDLFRLDVDIDGDGIADASTTATLAQLDAQL